MTALRDCGHCGVWTCSACGWKRHSASLARPGLQDCASCGGTEGTLRPTRHGENRWDMCNR